MTCDTVSIDSLVCYVEAATVREPVELLAGRSPNVEISPGHGGLHGLMMRPCLERWQGRSTLSSWSSRAHDRGGPRGGGHEGIQG